MLLAVVHSSRGRTHRLLLLIAAIFTFRAKIIAMNDQFPPSGTPEPKPLPPRNPITHAAHRREVLRQITLPLIVVSLLFLGAAIASWFTTSYQAGKLGDTSLIYLIFGACLMSLLPLLILGGLAYLVTMAIGGLPQRMRVAQAFFWKVEIKTREFSDKAVEPVLRAHELKAKAKALCRSTFEQPKKS